MAVGMFTTLITILGPFQARDYPVINLIYALIRASKHLDFQACLDVWHRLTNGVHTAHTRPGHT